MSPLLCHRDFVEIQGREFYVSKIFIHASYNQPKFANDIAIIELDKETDDEINDAVCLPTLQRSEGHETKSTIAIVKRAGGALKFGKAAEISKSECSSFFNQQFTDLTPGQFCANVHSNETEFSTFIGAVVLESSQKRQYVFKGFTSTAVRMGQAFDESKPYIFTDIEHHLNWIRAAIGDEFKRKPKLPTLDANKHSLRSCDRAIGDGYCVKLHQCSLYRNEPQQHETYLDQIKCFTARETDRNNIDEDGICCSSEYVELNATEEYDLDTRFQGKRGLELLDMKKCGQVDPSRRIVGGTKADLKEFPWVALIKYQVGRIFKFTCGSSLISDNYVLTCAHCISNLPNSFSVNAVRFGEYDRTTDPDCKLVDEVDNQYECNPPIQDIPIEKLIPHPKYNTPRYANDIGLVRLSRAPDMTQGK